VDLSVLNYNQPTQTACLPVCNAGLASGQHVRQLTNVWTSRAVSTTAV